MLPFLIISFGVYWWIDSFIRVYPSFLPWLMQTLLVWFLIWRVSQTNYSLLKDCLIALFIGSGVSVVIHNLFAFIYYDNFILSIREHYASGLLIQHLWFMCWSSLVTLGFVQAFTLMLLFRLKNKKV